METSPKKYPKFVHQNELASIQEKDWEPASETDKDALLVANDHDRATARVPAAPVPERVEEKSEVRLLVGPSSSPTPGPEPSVAPMPFMSNSAFESLLASTPPKAPALAIPPMDLRSSARPTVPLGPPALLVVSQADVQAQKLASAARLASLLSRPNEPLACALPRPIPLLPSVTKPEARRARWVLPVAALSAVIAAGALLFGVAHHLKTKAAHDVAMAAMEQEAAHAVAAPSAVEPYELDATPSAAAPAKKPAGPSQARAALAAGDLDGASTLFEELAENPSTRMDGLMGLAEISRARGDLAGARARYRDILTESPHYFPAKLGMADTTWDLGEKDAARKQYAALEPARLVPARARERAKH